MILRLILILLTINLSAQQDKVKHWYAAFGIAVITGEITYQIKDNKFISAGIGTGLATGTTWAKEYLWDDYLAKGVKSNQDGFVGTQGSLAGGLVIMCKLDFQEKRYYEKIDTTKFNNLK